MSDKLYKIYNWIELKIEEQKVIKPLEIFLKIIKKLIVLIFLSKVILRYHFYKKKPIVFGENKIVVSLTSFPGRISKVWLTLNSIEHQTIVPSKICLYLSNEEFPQGYASLPSRLKRYVDRGLEIIFVKDNLRSHLKYFYAFQTFKESYIVTVDDDLYYPKDTIERLLKLNNKFPASICANMSNEIVYEEGCFLSYLKWKKAAPFSSCKFNLALGVGGVLYPPTSRPVQLFQKTKIRSLAYYADDLWLKAIQIINDIEVAVGKSFPHPMVIPSTQKISLKKINSQNDILNDEQWEKLNKHFDLIHFF